MNRNSLSLKSVLIFFVLIFCVSKFNQALMVELSLKELTVGADAIILGEVKKVQSQWSVDGSIILTIATLQVHEMLKGEISSSQIIIQYPGGEVGDIGLKVSDTPSFGLEEKVLVFLKSITNLSSTEHSPVVCLNIFPSFSTFGAAQGKYSIDKDGIAQKSGYALISKEDERDMSLPLADLKLKIKSLLKQKSEKRERAHEKKKH
ncbi:MAG: hypothetical protein JSV96_18065 [Candidatus Aminicenantes bacterium]|nr:MAG: hypothetical protein JSV96_18065 [Candidatus Aminicenantes bacterium]